MRLLPAIFCLFALSAGAGEPGARRIEKEVRHELVMLPFYGIFDHLAFPVDRENVELPGAVTRPSLKADAERAVKHIEGAGIVENKIEDLPLSPLHDQIRLAAYRVTYGHTALNRYGLQAVPSTHILVGTDMTLCVEQFRRHGRQWHRRNPGEHDRRCNELSVDKER
jgi:hyperosmotically inducible protein